MPPDARPQPHGIGVKCYIITLRFPFRALRMRSIRRLPFALPLAIALCTPALAHDHSHDHDHDKEAEHGHSHGAHEHGVSRLDAVLEGKTLELSLMGPAHNFVGFEHAPETDADRASIAKAQAQLKDGAALFGLPAAAGCKLEDTDIDVDHGADKEAAHDHAHEHEDDHDHRDYSAEYRFSCQDPKALSAIDVGVFKAFPQTTEIRFQLAMPGAQSGGSLTPEDAVISLR
ncbi:DUF2796 domain-containing protein [Verticiella alkaliphila]|uniref:DUF2796 domain-containing protein n=1 Tax=Verticiella alkaliphila TaxID=2779529 RepID=UPI00209B73BC|nr:DUF2796 domain-containing protein [Verticiella sp. GG226]